MNKDDARGREEEGGVGETRIAVELMKESNAIRTDSNENPAIHRAAADEGRVASKSEIKIDERVVDLRVETD